MSALSQASILPFPIGTTFWQGQTVPDATTGVEWEGKEFVVEDLNYTNNSGGSQIFAPRAYGNQVTYKTVRIVRNVSGIALLPRRLAAFKTTVYGRQVDGYTTTTAAEGYPIDEFLPSTGVAANDLFYIVVEGPAECLTDIAASAANLQTAGATVVVALTAVTSQSTTAGRISAVDVSGNNSTGTPVLLAAINKIGTNMSGSTTNNTNNPTLVHIKKW